MSVVNALTVWLLTRALFQSLTRRTNVVSQLYRLRYAEFKRSKTLLELRVVLQVAVRTPYNTMNNIGHEETNKQTKELLMPEKLK